MPNSILEQIFASTTLISDSAGARTRQKIQERFGIETHNDDEYNEQLPIESQSAALDANSDDTNENAIEQERINNTEISTISFRKFPKNFKTLFAFQHKRYNCHGWRMSAAQIFEHEKPNLNNWLK